MERFRGHFYNWYDTRSLKPLAPQYVSMVDSGNLAAHLLTLRQGLLALAARPGDAGADRRLERLAHVAGQLARMDYGFLYDQARHLLAIGYNVDEQRLDASFYDLLASEARLAQLRRDRAGPAAAGELVRARPPAHRRRRRAGAAVVERLDVRVPDAAAGDAELREHAARPDLPRARSSGRSSTAASAACPGASPSPATTRSTRT